MHSFEDLTRKANTSTAKYWESLVKREREREGGSITHYVLYMKRGGGEMRQLLMGFSHPSSFKVCLRTLPLTLLYIQYLLPVLVLVAVWGIIVLCPPRGEAKALVYSVALAFYILYRWILLAWLAGLIIVQAGQRSQSIFGELGTRTLP